MERSLLYYSTNLKADKVTFSQALLKGLAPDKGLYLPESIPLISPADISHYSKLHYYEIAFDIIRRFLIGEIDDEDLIGLIKDAYDFLIPLEKVFDRKYVMRLDQGPTASFKDFAARMMGRLMQYYLKKENKKLLILTATSGDTGSAVANAFYGLDNIQILVLFPRSEVTERQRKQMTTLGKNVRILALDAKFDDCQSLVKQAFADPDLDYLDLSSANSINIGRLVPQIVYYFYAFSRLRLENHQEEAIIAVPSGNFGDMMGGVLAMKMGLPVRKLIIATNENDEFPKYLYSGEYKKIEPSRNCISSAMNVGHPSNLARLVALFGGMMDEKGEIHKPADMELMRNELYSVSISDIRTRETIRKAYQNYKLVLEPHGAVGWAGLMEYLEKNPELNLKDQLCISLETAHPAKFPEEIQKLIGIEPPLPKSLEGLDDKHEFYEDLPNNYQDFKEYLMAHF
ncbi:MAG: threonine synthase [Bacteroidales bacterium]|jgi:threonine synthase|nr:threonine synthase [Bacteroidales bacterium]